MIELRDLQEIINDIAHVHSSSRSDFNIGISEYEDHFRINTNNLRQLEIEMLQTILDEKGYDSYRFDRSGNQFLKVPKSS
jgi:hypothetical protein